MAEAAKIQLSYCDGHFVPSDFRKYCEQQGDILHGISRTGTIYSLTEFRE
ncbi:MAG: hypothetical protein ACXW02_05490 [Halobacteriota archaeon]|nr:hypothetical protein [Euryarchaeota archaeon]